MTEKYQIGKTLNFYKDFGNNSHSDVLNINKGNPPQLSFGKNVISCMKQVPFERAVCVGTGIAHN